MFTPDVKLIELMYFCLGAYIVMFTSLLIILYSLTATMKL